MYIMTHSHSWYENHYQIYIVSVTCKNSTSARYGFRTIVYA